MKRKRKAGVVLNHSTFVHGLRPVMDEIASWDTVKAVVPGRLRSGAHGPQTLKITVQRDTESGLKCHAHHGNQVQDLFITTADPDTVRTLLKKFS